MDDDTSDKDAAIDDAEDSGISTYAKVSDTSNGSKADSDSDFNVLNPDGWDKPLDMWGEIKDNLESQGLTLKDKEK